MAFPPSDRHRSLKADPTSRVHRIAVVIPRYGLLGGAENFVFELTERLARKPEFQVHVLANQWRRKSSAIRFHKIPVWPFPRWMRPVSFAAGAGRRLRREAFDLVHSHERIFGCHLFTFHGIPHRVWVRRVREKPMSLFDVATHWVEKRGMHSGDLQLLMPVSHLAREELIRAYPFLAPRVEVQHPGIETDRFDPADADQRRSRVRRDLGLQNSDILLLFVGMNFEVKRLQAVLDALRHLNRTGEHAFHLGVVGKGPIGRYRRMAAEMGVGDRVFFAGAVADVTDYYLAGDVFTMPSVYDTFGIAVLEAMAACLPVVISDRVGAKDLVKDGTSGFVVPDPANGPRLARAFAALSELSMRRRMGEAARSTALRQSWDRVEKEIARRYGASLRQRWG